MAKDNWAFGDVHYFTTWLQYEFNRQLSVSAKLKINYEDNILGRNLLVLAPLQTTNTENYGGKALHFGLGLTS